MTEMVPGNQKIAGLTEKKKKLLHYSYLIVGINLIFKFNVTTDEIKFYDDKFIDYRGLNVFYYL